MTSKRISQVRHVFMDVSEMSPPPKEEAESMSEAERHHYAYSMGFQRRWESFQEQAANREAAAFDAIALWGEPIKRLIERIEALEHELLRAIRLHLNERNPRNAHRQQAWTEEQNKLSIRRTETIYGTGGPEDEFASRYDSAITALEDFLRPVLRTGVRL